MERTTFQLYTETESWAFRLVHPDGTVLAAGNDDYATRDDAVEAIEAVRTAGEDADLDVFGPVTAQLRSGDGWRFRLIDRDREPLADGNRTYAERAEALDDVDRLRTSAADAPVFDVGDGIVWVDESDGSWRWRLVDSKRTTLATEPKAYDARDEVMAAVDTVRSTAPEAGQLDIDTLAFELHRDDDAWQWRLIDEDERTLAVSGSSYETREAAEDAIERARDTVAGSSIIEIDEVAFEFHEQEDGWGWRLVDEHGGSLAESVEPHETRQAAREKMLAVKDYAPDGETVVTG